jgi:hypothetical protein
VCRTMFRVLVQFRKFVSHAFFPYLNCRIGMPTLPNERIAGNARDASAT